MMDKPPSRAARAIQIMQTMQRMEWPTVARVAIVVGIGLATICLLFGDTTAASYAAIIGGLALLWVACTVDLTYASRIVLMGIEIDRRVELAEATIRRLQQAEAQGHALNTRLQELAGLLVTMTQQQRDARYVRGTDEDEAALDRTLAQISQLAAPQEPPPSHSP